MRLGLAVSIQRMVPMLGYHHVIILLLLPPLICHSLLLAGSSSSLPSIYVLSLRYEGTPENPASIIPPSNLTGLEVRAGYFLVAARSNELPWTHAPSENSLPIRYHEVQDPYHILATGSQFTSEVLFPGLVILVDVLCLLSGIALLNFPSWRDEEDRTTGDVVEVNQFSYRKIASFALVCLGFAVPLVFGSAVWQHTSAASVASLVETISQGQVNARVGTAAVALAWIPVLLIAIAFIFLLVLILSIRELDRLMGGD